MQMFAEVLILEGYEEIAQEADDALQRLLETPKFKGRNWQQVSYGGVLMIVVRNDS
jgi:hypothetical protein